MLACLGADTGEQFLRRVQTAERRSWRTVAPQVVFHTGRLLARSTAREQVIPTKVDLLQGYFGTRPVCNTTKTDHAESHMYPTLVGYMSCMTHHLEHPRP